MSRPTVTRLFVGAIVAGPEGTRQSPVPTGAATPGRV
jgi:hypothetical protein